MQKLKWLPELKVLILSAIISMVAGTFFSFEGCSQVRFSQIPTSQLSVVPVTCSGGANPNVLNICSCPSGQLLVNSNCVTGCTNGEQLVNGTCQCLSQKVDANGDCVGGCTGGQVCDFNTGGCTCPSNQEEVNGSCVNSCPGGQTYNTATQSCVCPTGQSLVNGTCTVCAQGTQCNCPAGYDYYGSQCTIACNGGQVRDPSTGNCVCGQGMQMYNSACVPACSAGHQFINGLCQCPSGTEDVNGVCQADCTGGNVRDPVTGGCVCPAGTDDFNGMCVISCNSGHVRNLQTGVCVCPSAQQVEVNGVCTDPTPTPAPTQAPPPGPSPIVIAGCENQGCYTDSNGIQICNMAPGSTMVFQGAAQYGATTPPWANGLPALGFGGAMGRTGPNLGYIPMSYPFTCTTTWGQRAVGPGNSGVGGKICEVQFAEGNTTTVTGTAAYNLTVNANATPGDTLYWFGLECNSGCTWAQPNLEVRICPP